jgi:superfamily II DNA/RNA helicase
LKAGVDIAVACPGRLADLASTGAISLHDVGVVVVDEADRMADMGFLPEVRRLLDQTRPDRQTMLFSATLDGDVDVLVRHYQRDPVRHVLDNDEAGAARAEHVFWRVEGPSRIGLAAAIVAARGATMVFCRTKHGTDRAAKQLTAKGVRAAAIHGDRSQAQRERALAAFAAGHVDVLVATDVAARGIHVDGVEAIVHFDPPTDAKDYLHRSGRTARAGASGLIVSFVTDEKSKAVMRMQRDLSFPVGAGAPDLASLATTKPRRRVPSTSPAPPARPDRPQRPTQQARGERAKRRARAERLSQPERAAPPAQRAGATQPEPVSRPGQPAGSGPRPVTDVGQRRRRRHTGKPVPGRSGRARRAG